MPYPTFDSLQSLFDFVTAKVIEQGERSVNTGRCYYRGPDGLKCAVGHLIPDKLYVPEMEGESVNGLCCHYGLPYNELEEIGLLRELQKAHDLDVPDENFVDNFKHKAYAIANNYRLKVNF